MRLKMKLILPCSAVMLFLSAFLVLRFAVYQGSRNDAIVLPIIMYHSIYPDDTKGNPPSVSTLEKDLATYKKAGFHTIFFQDLIDYVYNHGTLPDKPLIIMFDDGYLNNYTYAFPLLVRYKMKATMAIIGSSMGAVASDRTEAHFSASQAREMLSSGYIDIQSHSYQLHSIDYMNPEFRHGVLRKPDEELDDYIRIFNTDTMKQKELFLKEFQMSPTTFVYPFGRYDALSEEILKSQGFKVTVTTKKGVNFLSRDPNCLYKLKRINGS